MGLVVNNKKLKHINMTSDRSYVRCLCGTVNTPLAPLVSPAPSPSSTPILPLFGEICHCDSCRYSSGALCALLSPLCRPPPDHILARCASYASSAKITRYFCPTCGSKAFLEGVNGDLENEPVQWFVWGGLVESGHSPRDLDSNKIKVQVFVEDTLDGGLPGRMVLQSRKTLSKDKRDVDLVSTSKIYAGRWDGKILTKDELDNLTDTMRERAEGVRASNTDDAQTLIAQCLCAKVRFSLRRPLITDNERAIVPERMICDLPKFTARSCVCQSCRLALGHPLQSWAYVPTACIMHPERQPADLGTVEHKISDMNMKSYRSSDDVDRSFCGTCGASVFYENRKQPDTTRINVGILRSRPGSLAEDWLDWDWDHVDHVEERNDRAFIHGITTSV